MAFNFSKYSSKLFTTNGKEEENKQDNNKQEESGREDKMSYTTYGFRQAGSMHGSIEGLKICLNRVYQEHMADMRRDDIKQEELRKPFKQKLQDIYSTIESTKGQIITLEQELIPAKKKKIEELKKDIHEIKENPEHHKGQVGKVGYYIGIFILILLSLYLFVFYSSASYSALFKEFRITDIDSNNVVITKAIFDAKAISNALKDGITELILILTIPSVFIGLGYLMHKFQEAKGFGKYFKIAALLIVTFVFDAILAFEITKKIYDANAGNSFKDFPEFTLQMAFTSPSFWLIIFAGFVVYIVWGFVFDFVMDANSKLDNIQLKIRGKQDQISNIESEINILDQKVHDLKLSLDENNAEINKLKGIINGTIIQPKEVREALSQFMVGWYNWLSHGRQYNRSEHNKVYEDFVAQNVTIIESAINPN